MDTSTLTLPKALIDELAELAEREGRPAADVVRDAPAHDAVESGSDPGDPSPVRDGRLPSWFGIGTAVPDDGYDSATVKAWIRATWKPG